MTIIIETPAPPTRERLVLVPEGVPPRDGRPAYRDATPADLARAGYVPLAAFVGPLDLLSPPTLAGALEAIDGIRKDADRWEAEREEAASFARGAHDRAEKAERERDDLLARINDAEHAARCRGRERDTLRAELARLTLVDEEEPTDAALRDAFAEGERKRDARHVASPLRIVYRLGVAHERARQQPEKDRATDEELVGLYRKVYETHGGGTISVSHDDCRRAGISAVAARVRQECLVAQAVGMGAGVTISRMSERVPGTTGMWNVYVTRRPDVPGEHYAYGVPTADVPATLARLLDELAGAKKEAP